MSEIHHPPMDLEASTFECSTCGRELPTANQLTHEVACARMQRENNQRAPAAQPIVRQSSSSAIPDQVQQRAQPMPRREDRRVENKMVTCPTCEKSVREQDINSHMDNECLQNEIIPCEFCDQGIPMSNYGQHVDSCPRRPNNNRVPSPVRERPGSERQMQEEEPEEEHEESPQHNERDRSPERGSSQGGFRGFLRNLAGTAATHLFGTPEEQEQRRQEMQRLQEERRREQERQQEFLQHMFGQPQVPRNMAPSNQNALIPYRGPSSGSRVIRTIERGPGGSIIVRSRVVPAESPFQMFQQPQVNRPMEMNPLEMLLGMMGNGGFGGLQALGNGDIPAPEEQGLDKETIDSLATIKYNKETYKNLDEELKKCSICLDEFEDGQEVKFLWCTHRFHKGCVDTWLEKHTNCPICKKDFKDAEQGFSP